MRKRDRDMRRYLEGLHVPEHAPGFWEAVEDDLERVAAGEDIDAGDKESVLVPLGRQHRPRVSPWLAAAAAAAVVLASGGITALVFRPDTGTEVTGSEPNPTTTVAAISTTTTPADTVPVALTAPPWAMDTVRREAAPQVLTDAWTSAENKRWCSALVPTDLGAATGEATPRIAVFDGGWGVAWDLPSGPGQTADGEDCADCGRSAFGIAGTAAVRDAQLVARQADALVWSDGSVAGFEAGAQTARRQVATVVVAGQGCAYEVWSNLGDAHLRRLITSLRPVLGLQAEPVVMRRPGDAPSVTERALPPWSGPAVLTSAVDDLVLEQWAAVGIDRPQLVLAGLGSELKGATIRTWDGGVAWDLEDGPGHDAENRPCADCGRGVVGIGWQPVAGPVSVEGVSLPYRIEWSDGSWAEYGSRQASPAVPRDRVVYFDPETGEEISDGLEAIVHVTGMERDLIVWTHLGEAHLLYLIDQLRFVVPD
jgi:hypothetical protein